MDIAIVLIEKRHHRIEHQSSLLHHLDKEGIPALIPLMEVGMQLLPVVDKSLYSFMRSS